jgi:hypothetical protein
VSYLSITLAIIGVLATLACAVIACLDRRDKRKSPAPAFVPTCTMILGVTMNNDLPNLAAHSRGASCRGFKHR